MSGCGRRSWAGPAVVSSPADPTQGTEYAEAALREELIQLSEQRGELLRGSPLSSERRLALLEEELGRLAEQRRTLMPPAKRKRLPRDNYTWPWSTAADSIPDTSTQRFFWLVITVAVSAVALSLAVDKDPLEVKIWGAALMLQRADVISGTWLALGGFTAIYLMLCFNEVARWVRLGEDGFAQYRADKHEDWEALRSPLGVDEDDYPKHSKLDIGLGCLKLVYLLVPLLVAGAAVVVLRT